MNRIKLFTDSTCDLSKDMLEEKNISIVPLYVNFDESSYKDTVDIDTIELYRLVEEYGVLPKTSSPSVMDFYVAFKPYVDSGCDIVYIGLSSKLSSTIQNAKIAADEFQGGRIYVIDSLNLSTGIGILVMKAASMLEEGLSASEIADEIEQNVHKVQTAFTIDTFEYLYKGGRCSAIQGIVGSMLNIKPITKVIDGSIILHDKQRGRKKALASLLQEITENKENLDESMVFVTHSLASDDAEYLKQELQRTLKLQKVFITNAGCVISSHCGKETIGIIYLIK